MHLVYRQTCRVCGSTSLKPVINLGNQYLQGSFVKAGGLPPPMRKIGCQLVRCNPEVDEKACGLLQMDKTVPPEILYSSYGYKSGLNMTMKLHLSDLCRDLLSMNVERVNNIVLDIGANDGTLLSFFAKEDPAVVLFGVDPSDIAQEAKILVPNAIISQGLYPHPGLCQASGGKKFDIITAIAMLYDLESPVDFARAIKMDLSKDGIFCFEMAYMPKMLEMNSYDGIVHEHLEFYSLAVVEKIMAMADMKIVRVSFSDINGGSIRCCATHVDCFEYEDRVWQEEIRAVRRSEFDMALDTDIPYMNFQYRVSDLRNRLRELLLGLKKEGKKIHVYGASTKGNTILQYSSIDTALVDYAVERNPEKWGGKTLGTNIPIISEEESRKLKPDYMLANIWHFRREIIERESEFLARGGKFIFPIPEVEIYPSL